jgi:hypothetical protein
MYIGSMQKLYISYKKLKFKHPWNVYGGWGLMAGVEKFWLIELAVLVTGWRCWIKEKGLNLLGE